MSLAASPDGRSPAEPGSTRERLIQAGFRLWLEEPPAVLFSGFSVSRIAKAAGVTRATFYAYWPTADDYLGDLASELVDGAHQLGYDRLVSTTAGTVGMSRGGAVGVMLESCAREFDRLVNDPALRVRLGFLSKMDDPEVLGKALTASGLDAAKLFARAQEPEIKNRLMTNTQSAVERGAFGSPTFFVGDEMFFGKEQLREVEELIAGR